MGTDIHLRVEKRNGDTVWHPAEQLIPQHTVYSFYEKGTPEGDELVPERWYDSRNYNVFAMLADIRNGRGFAGCYTGDGFWPILGPGVQRGLPDDLSAELRAMVVDEDGSVSGEDYWFGDHSFSWLTAAELFDYDWAQETARSGMIDVLNAEEWFRYGRQYNKDGPKEFCGDVSGPMIRRISADEMERRIEAIRESCGEWRGGRFEVFQEQLQKELAHHYCRVEWTQTYARAAGEFYVDFMPRLKRLANGARSL